MNNLFDYYFWGAQKGYYIHKIREYLLKYAKKFLKNKNIILNKNREENFMSIVLPTTIKGFFCMFFSMVMSLVSVFQGIGTAKTTEMPTAPDDFVPAVRFAVCSDTHNQNQNVAEMIDRCYEIYDGDTVYSGIDLFAFCGDMTSVGENDDMDAFKQTLDEHVKGDTQILVLLGNHELKNPASRDYFTELYGVSPEQHIVVNGFHFISVSNSYENAMSISAEVWANKEADKALAATPDLPIFSFQHPHNFGTVYGSTVWASPQLSSAWEGKSNIVNFSGHSHFPMNDPRSIWQGSYTALGCGGMDYFELENDLLVGQHPDGYEDAAQFYIVEADLDGSVRVRCYDLVSDGFFGEEYYIDDVTDKSCFAYSHNNRKDYDEAPVWKDDTQIELAQNEDGEYRITFDEAVDKLIVQNYKIRVLSNGFPIYAKTHIADYYLINNCDTASFNLGELNLKSGKEYKIEITAVNAYAELSQPMTWTYIAE